MAASKKNAVRVRKVKESACCDIACEIGDEVEVSAIAARSLCIGGGFEIVKPAAKPKPAKKADPKPVSVAAAPDEKIKE